jgi:hypothetical protein
MRSPANTPDPAAHSVEKRAPVPSGNLPAHREAVQPTETLLDRIDHHRLASEAPGVSSKPGILGSSLQRLYDSDDSIEPEPLLFSQGVYSNNSDATLDLTESLLDAVFEISEFDPLPHLNYREDDFDFGLLTGSPHYPAPQIAPSKRGTFGGAPLSGRPGYSNTTPDNLSGRLSGMDRRRLPRRESDCIVSICRCRGEERLTAERIAWMLHATKLKGQLIDVSMSGVGFYIKESLAAGSEILLRISNRMVDKQVDTSATIIRSRPVSKGGWDVVCRFHKNLTFEQIHTVGRSLFAATIV